MPDAGSPRPDDQPDDAAVPAPAGAAEPAAPPDAGVRPGDDDGSDTGSDGDAGSEGDAGGDAGSEGDASSAAATGDAGAEPVAPTPDEPVAVPDEPVAVPDEPVAVPPEPSVPPGPPSPAQAADEPGPPAPEPVPAPPQPVAPEPEPTAAAAPAAEPAAAPAPAGAPSLPVVPGETATATPAEADLGPPLPPLDEPAGGTGGDDAAAEGHRIGRTALAVLVVMALLALLGTGYLAWQVRQEARAEAARTEALAAARDAARLLFSYDHDQLEQDFEAGVAVTTGDFREEYERTTREVVTPVATEYDAVVEAEVVEAGVVAAEPDRVVTLVYVNQTTTSTRVEGPKIDQSRVRMGLRLIDGEWLVERVDAL